MKNKNYKIWWYLNWSPYFDKSTDVHTIVVSNKIPFSKEDFKYFFGYKDAEILEIHI